LILATQRPSVDVNHRLDQGKHFPARISFPRGQQSRFAHYSRPTAPERCSAKAICFYLPAGSARLHRIHGPLVSETRSTAVCDFSGATSASKYNEELLARQDEMGQKRRRRHRRRRRAAEEVDDDLYQDACARVCEMAALPLHAAAPPAHRLRPALPPIDLMEKDGIVGPPDGTQTREVLKPQLDEEFRRHTQVKKSRCGLFQVSLWFRRAAIYS